MARRRISSRAQKYFNRKKIGGRDFAGARAGDSIEDLWALHRGNSRGARLGAPFTVSGVGHEADFTIAVLWADVRASQPSAACCETRGAVPGRNFSGLPRAEHNIQTMRTLLEFRPPTF